MTDRGQSTALDYAIALAVTLLIVIGLVTAASGFVEDRRSNVLRTELRVIGQHLAAEITAADRLTQAGDAQAVVLNRSLPGKVTGTEYTITITDAGSHDEITLATDDPEASVTVHVRTTTDLAETGINGGDVAVVYDQSGNHLEVRS